MQTIQGLLLIVHNMEVSVFTFRSCWCIAGRHDMLLIAMKTSSKALDCCILTRKANQASTVDREIFALKIIRVKIFRIDKFSRFRLIREIFLTVDDCNMDERLESLWLLIYYQVSGEPGIARCSHQSDIYLCGLARKLIH